VIHNPDLWFELARERQREALMRAERERRWSLAAPPSARRQAAASALASVWERVRLRVGAGPALGPCAQTEGEA
jgi:hypothetical protein